MVHVLYEPFSRTWFWDACVMSSQRLSMILKVSSMWTTSSAWVASNHYRKPLLLLFVVVVVVLLLLLLLLLRLLTRRTRLQPIVIQSQRFLAIITVTCQDLFARWWYWAKICVVWTRLIIIIIIVFICIAPYLRNYNSVQRRLLQHWHDYKAMLNHTSDSIMAVER